MPTTTEQTDERWRCSKCTMSFHIGPAPRNNSRRDEVETTRCVMCKKLFWHHGARNAAVVGMTVRPQ